MIKQATMAKKIWAVLGVGSVILGAASTTQAQVTVFEGLPPLPPNIPSLRQAPRDSDNQVMPAPPQVQEFNFEAPRSSSSYQSNTQQYRVEVPTSDPLMLATVKKIEPTAFMKGDRIQAGLFSQQSNAQNLQDNLQAKGIKADIVTVAANTNVPAAGSSSDAGYFVAIPTSKRNESAVQSKLLQMGINSYLIQARSAPRGYHLAIGPFGNRDEASSINTLVRGASLDGRLYFQD